MGISVTIVEAHGYVVLHDEMKELIAIAARQTREEHANEMNKLVAKVNAATPKAAPAKSTKRSNSRDRRRVRGDSLDSRDGSTHHRRDRSRSRRRHFFDRRHSRRSRSRSSRGSRPRRSRSRVRRSRSRVRRSRSSRKEKQDPAGQPPARPSDKDPVATARKDDRKELENVATARKWATVDTVAGLDDLINTPDGLVGLLEQGAWQHSDTTSVFIFWKGDSFRTVFKGSIGSRVRGSTEDCVVALDHDFADEDDAVDVVVGPCQRKLDQYLAERPSVFLNKLGALLKADHRPDFGHMLFTAYS